MLVQRTRELRKTTRQIPLIREGTAAQPFRALTACAVRHRRFFIVQRYGSQENKM